MVAPPSFSGVAVSNTRGIFNRPAFGYAFVLASRRVPDFMARLFDDVELILRHGVIVVAYDASRGGDDVATGPLTAMISM